MNRSPTPRRMRTQAWQSGLPPILGWIGLLSLGLTLLTPWSALGLGSWTTVVQAPPNQVGLEHMLLLSDGTVMAQQAGNSPNWFRLTPDLHGSYINGSWSTLKPMNYSREFYTSAVLRDGRVFFAGGEYGTGGNKAEVYSPWNNSWTEIPVPAGLICTTCAGPGFSDSGSIILADGTLMIAPVQPGKFNGTVIFDPVSNSLSQGPSYLGNQNEATWVKLPDESILTIDPTQNATLLNSSERFIPALKIWINDAPLPVPMYNSAQEIGAGLLLADGRAFFIGGLGHTAYYTPSGTTAPGTWSQGPELLDSGVGWDEPAALMVNGKVLLQTACGPNQTPQPRCYYEMDPYDGYPVGKITRTVDWGDTSGIAHHMLTLPDGSILVSYGASTLRVYQPDGMPVASGKPVITSITFNNDGSYHLTGTTLNGLSQGASFGDDAQMDSNYPLVRVSDQDNNVYYLPTLGWSSTGVATGAKLVSTDFVVSSTLAPTHAYSLVVVANGISSDPVTFHGPVWVDVHSNDSTQIGSYDFPYHTFAQAIGAVPTGGAINFKNGGSTPETVSISKAMSIFAVGGPITIGQ